jgi:hypothetical protein
MGVNVLVGTGVGVGGAVVRNDSGVSSVSDAGEVAAAIDSTDAAGVWMLSTTGLPVNRQASDNRTSNNIGQIQGRGRLTIIIYS